MRRWFYEVFGVARRARSCVANPPDMIVRINPYMVELWAVVEDQGGSGPVVHVKLIDISGVDIGKDVAVDNNERFVIPEIFNILYATPGAQDVGFVTGHNGDAIGLLFHKL
ncbi:MAG: hypothetical protein JRJ47_12145, partial [Deltaproteobacteria bacterium]|nr:hypothetical protein [Deltaproteobacteria bacterium]